MIVGIGVDIVSVDKMRKAVLRWGDPFLYRVFFKEEIEIFKESPIYYQKLAARFAAKEAVIKSLGGVELLSFKDMLITNASNGAPICSFKNERADISILVSLTHIKDYAVATAVAQKNT